MDSTIELQQHLLQVLLKRLKDCSLENLCYQAAILNLPESVQARVTEMRKFYRQEKPVQEKVETAFRDLDELFVRLQEGIAVDKYLQAFLERYDPGGLPN